MTKKGACVFSAYIDRIAIKGLKKVCLLKNIHLIEGECNITEFRDHVWVDYHENHFSKDDVGKNILFVGKKYKYENSNRETKEGVAIKKTLSIFE